MADFRSSVKHPHLLIFLGGMDSGGSKKQTLPYLFVIIAVFQLTVSLLFETFVVKSRHVYATIIMW